MTRAAKPVVVAVDEDEEIESTEPGPRFPNAPDWTEFPKLKRLQADRIMDKAIQLKKEIATREEELRGLYPILHSKIDLGLGDVDVNTVNYRGVGFQRVKGGERKGSLNRKWVKITLLRKGITEEEMDNHRGKSTVIQPSVKIFMPGEAKKPWESDDDE